MNAREWNAPLPFVLLLGLISMIIVILLPATKHSILVVWGGFSAIMTAVLVHELGHLAIGWLKGLKPEEMRVGPLKLTFQKGSVRLRANESWMFFGGVVRFSPPECRVPELTKKYALTFLAGPVASLALGLALFNFIIFFEPNLFFEMVALISLALGVTTIIPFSIPGGLQSDGYNFSVLTKGEQKAVILMATVLLQKEYLSAKRPAEWNEVVSEEAISSIYTRNSTTAEELAHETELRMLLYYYLMDTGKPNLALQIIEPVALSEKPIKSLPNSRIFIDGFYISHLILYSSDLEEKHNMLERIVQDLSKQEPYSYHKAWAAYLSAKGNFTEARQHLQQAQALMERWYKPFGSYYTEKNILSEIEKTM